MVSANNPSRQSLEAHEFAFPPEGHDHWPPEWPRKVGFVIGQLQLGLELCASGACLAVLPDAVANAYPRPGRLRRLPFDLTEPVGLYAVYREPLGLRNKTELVLEKLREL